MNLRDSKLGLWRQGQGFGMRDQESCELVPNLSLGDTAVHPQQASTVGRRQGWVDRLSEPHFRQVLACNVNLF